MTVRLGTRVPDISVGLGAAILSGGGSPPAPAATMPNTALYLPGTAGNYVSTPDDASLGTTGDFSAVLHMATADWTPATLMDLASRDGSALDRGWYWRLQTDGQLRLYVSNDGTNGGAGDSTASVGFADGTDGWVAFTADVDNGAGGTDIKFWTSTDGTSWSQLGSTLTLAQTGAYDNDNALFIGAGAGGLNLSTGAFYKFEYYLGIGANTAPGQGTLVYEADFSHPWVGNRYTDSTGKVSTINGSAWAWEIPE